MTISTLRNRPSLHLRHSSTFCAGLLVFAAFSSGCKKTDDQPKETSSVPAASSAAPKSSAPVQAPAKPAASGGVNPTGPALIVVPGIGLGAIRFGATFETVERHMGAPCDIRTENRCGYVRQAVEFSMTDGVVSGMSVQRRDRQVKDAGAFPEKLYGAFNGAMAPEVMLGLHRHVVLEEFGEPVKKEPLLGPDGQVERHIYPGVVLEYDKIENGNTVLAAITVVPDKKAPPHPRSLQIAVKKPAAPEKKTDSIEGVENHRPQ